MYFHGHQHNFRRMTRMRYCFALLMILIAGGSHAQVTPQIPPGTMLGCSTNNASACAPTALKRKDFYVEDYGAACNGTTDDHGAWQGAINAAAAVSYLSATPLAAKIHGCTTGQSLITTSLNFTGFSGYSSSPSGIGITVDMTGTCLIGQTSGYPVIDALGSRFINWEHLCIYGSATNSPNIGIQIGRTSTNSADVHYFNRPVIQGYFASGSGSGVTLSAAYYNNAAETVTIVDPWFTNGTSASTAYAYVGDGANHFNINSQFVTVTAPVDTAESFNENVVYGGWIGTTSASPLWLECSARHRFIGGYQETGGTIGATLFESATCYNTDLYLDVHYETVSLTNVFLITGTGGTHTFNNFTYIDHYPEAGTSIFKLDSGVTAATFNNLTLKIDTFYGGNGVTVWDTAANYSVSGSVYVPNAGNWTVPATFSGSICIANTCDGYKNPGGSISNTAIGNGTMTGSVSGTNDIALGFLAGNTLTSGSNDVLLGNSAGRYLTTTNNNTAMGTFALSGSSVGTAANNTALGYSALGALSSSNYNVAVGSNAGVSVTSGSHEVIIGGSSTAPVITTGSSNTIIGYNCEPQSPVVTTTTDFIGICAGGNAALEGYGLSTLISVTSGGGTSPTIAGQGTFLFWVTEGSTGTPSATLVLGMPAAATDWGCDALDRTSTTITARQTGAASTTAVTITFSSAPANSDRIQIKCLAN